MAVSPAMRGGAAQRLRGWFRVSAEKGGVPNEFGAHTTPFLASDWRIGGAMASILPRI